MLTAFGNGFVFFDGQVAGHKGQQFANVVGRRADISGGPLGGSATRGTSCTAALTPETGRRPA